MSVMRPNNQARRAGGLDAHERIAVIVDRCSRAAPRQAAPSSPRVTRTLAPYCLDAHGIPATPCGYRVWYPNLTLPYTPAAARAGRRAGVAAARAAGGRVPGGHARALPRHAARAAPGAGAAAAAAGRAAHRGQGALHGPFAPYPTIQCITRMSQRSCTCLHARTHTVMRAQASLHGHCATCVVTECLHACIIQNQSSCKHDRARTLRL